MSFNLFVNFGQMRWQEDDKNWITRTNIGFGEDKTWILKTNTSQTFDKDLVWTYIGQNLDIGQSQDKLLRTNIVNQHHCFNTLTGSVVVLLPRVEAEMWWGMKISSFLGSGKSSSTARGEYFSFWDAKRSDDEQTVVVGGGFNRCIARAAPGIISI